MEFVCEQLLLNYHGRVGDVAGVHHTLDGVFPAGRAHESVALPLSRGGQPAGKGGRIADPVQLFHQPQPDVLADVAGLGLTQPVSAADGPNQWGIPFDERVPRRLLVVPGALDQVRNRLVITHPGCPNGHDLGSPYSPRAVTVAGFTLTDGRAVHHEQRPHNRSHLCGGGQFCSGMSSRLKSLRNSPSDGGDVAGRTTNLLIPAATYRSIICPAAAQLVGT